MAIFFPFLRNVCLDLSILLYGYYLCHYDKVMTFLVTYQKRIYAITACLSLGTIGLYYYNTKILGLSRHYAHLVHQSYMMIYAIFMIVTIFALYLTQTASLAIYGLVIDWINPYLSDVVFHWVIFWCWVVRG